MASDKVLKKIKKTYGERFMKMCRTHFPTILEDDEKLYEILQASFSDISETLYEDIQNSDLEGRFVDFIFEKAEEKKEERIITDKTPYELLDEAGYELIECQTEEEIQSFKKYYARKEQLCTFHGGRLEECIVFWAVKKNVAQIKRKDFDKPERDDEYGTSVMSIQFSRTRTSRVSIKNRYNHTVMNPDATLGNDLERIAPGLTYSFGRLLEERGLKLKSNEEEFGIPGYVKANDGKFYKYNTCIGNTFYCPKNIVIVDGEVQKIADPEKHYLIDGYLIDIEKKTISMYDKKVEDAFIDALTDIQKITIVKDKTSGEARKNIIIQIANQEEPIVITVDRDDKIISYRNHGLREVGDNFMSCSTGLEVLDTPNLERMGDDCCCWSSLLKDVNLTKLRRMGNSCFSRAQLLKTLDLSELEETGNRCFMSVPSLEEISAPKLKKVGARFLGHSKLTTIHFEELEEVGDGFACGSRMLESVDLPKLEMVGDDFLTVCKKLKSVRMKSLKKAGEYFLDDVEEIVEFETPKISRLKWFFSKNRHVVSIINNAKKAQRLSRKDIARLDRQAVLVPEEVEVAGKEIETPANVRNKEELVNIEDSVI